MCERKSVCVYVIVNECPIIPLPVVSPSSTPVAVEEGSASSFAEDECAGTIVHIETK